MDDKVIDQRNQSWPTNMRFERFFLLIIFCFYFIYLLATISSLIKSATLNMSCLVQPSTS